MRVLIPSPLRSYSGGRAEVDSSGATVAELLERLDAAFPGIRFRMIDEQNRIRQHIRIFANGELVRDLDQQLAGGDEVQVICALSGG
jgi:molybdopterin synthase sulfur carrier subunit